MSQIKNRIQQISQQLPSDCQLIAVSKYYPVQAVMDAYEAGQRQFAENKVQDLLQKQAACPADIQWHMIGTLQRNKVKYIVPFVHCIHSIDSERLLQEVDKRAAMVERQEPVQVLFQLHLAQESSKAGFEPEAFWEWVESRPWERYTHLSYAGLMCMASHTDDTEQIRGEFRRLRQILEALREKYAASLPESFCQLSMGMSGDYPIAVEEGATMVRIGSGIFANP